MPLTEEQAIAQCKQGDTQAFGVLYDAYIKKIYDFVYYKTLHKETAEDLVSVVFTKAFEKIHTFDGTEGTFSSWVYRIARNTVIDHYRTQKKEKDIDDVWDLSGDDDIQRDIDVRAQLDTITEYMQQLTGEQRDILVLRLWQGMSHAEIAETLGKTEGSVKVAYSRAISKVRAEALALLIFILSQGITQR